VASEGVYYLNGVADAAMPNAISGFTVSHRQPSDHQHVFVLDLGKGEYLYIKTYKNFVSVLIRKGQSTHFGDSIGLMGDFEMG
jgi:hypothetical protein